MINQVLGVIGSLYYVEQAEKVQKHTDVDKKFKKTETEPIRIQRINRVMALNEHEKNTRGPDYVNTQIVHNEEEGEFVVYSNSCCGYRYMKLNGEEEKVDFTLMNPVKIKRAYFDEEV
ncbi:MAG: hypothetical protein E7231_10255 [Cellulosilyticum sp.]|nr:hypothetical protein [Cellulosilyticum sp.]